MGYRVEEWTEASDKNEAARALSPRVYEEALELVSPTDVPKGEWVAFDVKLASGESFFEGMGRCEECHNKDGVFMVRLGMLQLDPMNELMFERIQIEQEASERTGEVDVRELKEAADATPAIPAPSAIPSPSMAPSSVARPNPDSTPSWRPPAPRVKVSAPPPPVVNASAPPPPPAIQSAAPPAIQPPSPPPRPAPVASSSPSGTPTPLAAPSPLVASNPSARPAAPAPEAPKAQTTVSGFPAPAPSDLPVSDVVRARLEPMLLALRRAGAARQVEDAQDLALELGLQALERVFKNS